MDHPFTAYIKLSEKLTFLIPCLADVLNFVYVPNGVSQRLNDINHLSADTTKWSICQFVANNLSVICWRIVLSLFDHFEGMALKGLIINGLITQENSTVIW